MSQKRSQSVSNERKKQEWHFLSLEIELEILKWIDKNEHNVDIQRNGPESTLRTIQSNADII